jgi:hypothetical protein
MSEGEKGGEKETGQLRCKATLYIHTLLTVFSQPNNSTLLKYSKLSNNNSINIRIDLKLNPGAGINPGLMQKKVAD